MGCNCGGAKRAAATERTSREAKQTEQRPKPTGGPGEPGYYWVGPQRPPKTDQSG